MHFLPTHHLVHNKPTIAMSTACGSVSSWYTP